jgi:asparagine synthase (glutamine-hydrolysing)
VTIIAGAFSINGHHLPDELVSSLKRSIPGKTDIRGEETEYENLGFYLKKWDSGAFKEPAWSVSNDGVATLVGDPLLTINNHRISRGEQLSALTGPNHTINLDLLQKCRGSFSHVTYGSHAHRLSIATDRIGVRSVYYVLQDGLFVFSSSLSILESIPSIRRSVSSIGVAEQSIFGFPLAARTPYNEIFLLRECEVVNVDSSEIKQEPYFSWSETYSDVLPPHPTAESILSALSDAIRLRAGTDTCCFSFLSGGMDSRTIVTLLMKLGVKVEALNFSYPGSQDAEFARMFSEQYDQNCNFYSLNLASDYPNFSLLAKAAKEKVTFLSTNIPERPSIIWSGDGGSVGLGYVYINQEAVSLLNSNRRLEAIDQFLNFNKISLRSKAFTKSESDRVPSALLKNISQKLDRYPRHEKARQLYLFLLFNDQRRHLFKHYETINQHGLELLTPFLDPEFLQIVMMTPMQAGLFHNLYMSVFDLLPARARSTPWQTYPGHAICPVVTAKDYSYQWSEDDSKSDTSIRLRASVSIELISVLRKCAPCHPFSRTRVAGAALGHLLGVNDARPLLKRMKAYSDFSHV